MNKLARLLFEDGELIVTPRYRDWLISKGEEPLPAWVLDRINAEMRKVPRVRTATFSASSGGMCLRRQELAFLGVQGQFGREPDTVLLNIFDDGKWRHLRWQAHLLAAGILTDIEYRLKWKRMRSMGSMDGIGEVPDDHPTVKWRGKEFGFELKGVNGFDFPRYVKADKQKEEHIEQIHRYMLMAGFDLFVVLYENKSTNEWHEWVVEADPALLKKSQQDLEQMNDDIDNRELNPMLMSCSKHIGNSWQTCPFGGVDGPCEAAGQWPRRISKLAKASI